ncbi:MULTISPECIES: phage capsid protein [Enterococcus]|uniref:phage capsid protein n=1 Tax=Enterococcus TaxID=1350 RepID=UPI000C176F62|nr:MULTISPECIES: phage capsid protein [Enterococcus]ATU29616.1 phage capsid protein [Enterococcus faecium]EGP5343693.1 phage capsid protein [Enterococcus faecium]EGP5362803.1 phage capsid protein [Enterococcus faecium]EGP5512087.1 phage capsid protein [Enterococcus faecium]EGP5671231.1 phage capsid protein [Enterococcus faecium]
MKNMSKTNKEKLLKMNLQMFAAETGLTTMEDLGEIKSIDFVNRFEAGIKELLELLGVTRIEPLSRDMKIQMYKWTASLKDGAVAEGEDIPLSKVTRAKDKSFSVTFNKWRRAVSAESIARHGASLAIDQADNKLLRQIQGGIKTKFVDFLGTAPTKVTSDGLQKALAQSWGKLSTFEEFDGAQFVSFVNPMDVANYLGDTKVLADASNVFGMTLLKNFLGATNVIVLNAVPEGKVYSTAVDNIVLAYLDMKASDLGDIFVDFTDETGLISATRGRTLRNATYESLFMNALVLFPEIPAGVVEATIDSTTTTTTQPTTTTTTTQG